MAARARHSKALYAKSPVGKLGDEGAERYMWIFREGNLLVLAIPGLRDLKLSVNEARSIGEMLIQAADEMTDHGRDLGEGGNKGGGSKACPVDS